jgi:1-acyl-sn-glycerol-3-phosphate acyltransferase
MNVCLRSLYWAFFKPVGAYNRFRLDLRVWGREKIPKGPKIYAVNHITSYDVFYVLPLLPDPLHVIIGPGYQSPWTGRLLDLFEQINALNGNAATLIRSAVAYLRRGEAVGIAPQGNLQDSSCLGKFFPGIAAIYRQARVPIVPIALAAPRSALREFPRRTKTINGHVYRMIRPVRGPYCVNIGEPFEPEIPGGAARKEENEHSHGLLRHRLESLVADVRANKFWS